MYSSSSEYFWRAVLKQVGEMDRQSLR
jgi:hypothetical protein